MPTVEEFLTGKDLIDKFKADLNTNTYYNVEWMPKWVVDSLAETNTDVWHRILSRAFTWSDTENEEIWINLYKNLRDGNYE